MGANTPAKGNEVEVTREMIEAGRRALAGYDPARWSEDECDMLIAEAYRAMATARPSVT